MLDTNQDEPFLLYLVDDEPSVLRTLARAVAHLGHKVRTFNLAAEALVAIGDERPHAVISDYYMPGTNGVAFLTQVRSKDPTVGRVILTGGFVDDRLQDAQGDGTVQILVNKPWSTDTLRRLFGYIRKGEEGIVLTDAEGGRSWGDEQQADRQGWSPPKKGTVLVVDDDKFFLSLIASMLLKLGYTCRTSQTRDGLIELVEKEPVDVLLMDLVMPGGSGPDLIATVRKLHPEMPILAVTGSLERDLGVSALWKGANGLLQKPLQPDLLEAALRRSMQFRQLFQDQVGRSDLSALVELQHAIASGMETDELLKILLQQMIRFTGADNASVLLVQPDGCSLRRAAAYGMGQASSEDRVDLGGKFSEWMQEFSKPQLIMECSDSDPRLAGMSPDASPAVGLCVPMRGRDALLGVLCVSSQNDRHLFSRDAVDIGLLLAGEAARALEREDEVEQQRDIEQAVMRRDKLVTIGELASGVAHEINNPLAYVNSNLNSLEEYVQDMRKVLDALGTKDDSNRLAAADKAAAEVDLAFVLDDLPNCIKETRNGIDRVLKIVNDLKGFARDDMESREYANVNQILDGAVNILWNQIKYKAKVSKDYGKLPQIRCFPSQLGQVFLNLLYNATQSIEREGRVDLRTMVSGDQIVIEVGDNGCGMDSATQRRIFEPFFTTKPRGVGTGLGLSIGYKIVKRHGGQIAVTSQIGQGTTFRVSLPLVAPGSDQ